MKLILTLSAVTLTGLAYAATTSAADGDKSTCSTTTSAWSSKPDIVETAVAAGKFKTLATALESAGLIETLQGDGPFTVFAPSDSAFAKLPEGTVASLLESENRGLLTNILTFHVVPGRVAAADVAGLESATALNGQRFSIKTSDAGVFVGGAKVVRTDIECGNGIIHVVDSVMMPATGDIIATAVEAGDFKTLAAAIEAAGLVEALQGEGPFTVFAPTDEAFAALPEGTVASLLEPANRHKLVAILKYHVVSGRVYSDQLANGQVATIGDSSLEISLRDRGAFVNGAKVVKADIETTNGVIHVVDQVLIPGK